MTKPKPTYDLDDDLPDSQLLRDFRAAGERLRADDDQWHAMTCQHPATRLYAWTARDDLAPGGRILVVACCDCGAVLHGGAASATEGDDLLTAAVAAWSDQTREALAFWLGRAATAAGIDDKRQRLALQEELARLFGELD